jgi:quinol monooxygenase YgiN
MFTSLSAGVVCVLIALLAVPNVASAQEDPIVAFVKKSVKDPNKPFTLIVGVKVKEGASDKFESAFAKCIKATREEKGCIRYELNRGTENTAQYQVYERWKTVADLEAHLKTDHIKELRSVIGDLVVGDRELKVMTPAGE